MPYRLIDRNRQIPNGMLFYQPQTKWRSTPWASFSNICQQVISHRNANPWLNLPMDLATVEIEVDEFNAQVCAQMGWKEYIMAADGGAANVPFPNLPQPKLGSRLLNVAAGAEANVEFIASGADAVSPEVSAARALICTQCPLNGKGDLTRFFTVPLSESIRTAIGKSRDLKLTTPHDDQLGVCEACDCPLKLKVHFPIKLIREKIRDSARARLHPKCWILNEP